MLEETYCRLCAVKTDRVINIYEEEGEKLNLATKIIQCLQIWLYPEDVLPKTVCIHCCSKVNQYFEFFQLSSQSQISLMSMYNKEKHEEEKSVINKIKDEHIENNVVHKYEDNIGNQMTENCIEYTNLVTPEKNKGTTETQIEQQLDQLKPSKIIKSERKNKKVLRRDHVSEEEDGGGGDFDDEDDDDDPKHSAKGQYMWKCTDCSAELKTLPELRRHHTEVHNQEPVFSCTMCTKTYTRYRSYARHVSLHRNLRKFSCDICGKQFSQKTVLQSHAAVHSEERPHSCSHCGKAFKQLSSLYLHSKRHLPSQSNPKFPCTHCSKEFSTKHTLEVHLKLHKGERNYVCDICGKRFIAKNSLYYHINTHGDTKPHSCGVCGKCFKTTRLLAKHSSLHTGIKPHQCDVCGKQFRERGALREHNRIHTGVMPYSCELCGKVFRFKGILTVHMRQHTGERPYRCSDCHRGFTNWANYNKHMKRRHRDSEHNSLLAARLVQREAEQVVVSPTDPPAAGQVPPLIMQPLTHYETVDTTYKIVEEDIYRVPNYVPSMSYYSPPIQHTVLQARSQ